MHAFRTAWLAGSLFVLLLHVSCGSGEENAGNASGAVRDSLPVLRSLGVSTLISDSGVIRYKIISEDWFVYDKKDPTYWEFNKGMFIEKYGKDFKVEAFISCDTAYYYDQKRLWELRGRVLMKNLKGETFKTSLLYWDQNARRFYSPAFMQIKGIEQELSGYDFSSNEQMTDYTIHNSVGALPVSEKEHKPAPDEQKMQEYADSTAKNVAEQ